MAITLNPAQQVQSINVHNFFTLIHFHLFQFNIIQLYITFPLTPCANYRAKYW